MSDISCMLKVHGVVILYREKLRGLRQSGDIGMLVDCDYKKAAQFVSSVLTSGMRHPKYVFQVENCVGLHRR